MKYILYIKQLRKGDYIIMNGQDLLLSLIASQPFTGASDIDIMKTYIISKGLEEEAINMITELKNNKKVFIKEYAAILIDAVEDFLEEKNVIIENDEKENEQGEAIIYGTDFDILMAAILPVLKDLVNKINPSIEIDVDNWN